MKEIMEIRTFDYESKDEYKEHKEEMESKGYRLIRDGKFGGMFDSGEVVNGDKLMYSASFVKSDLI